MLRPATPLTVLLFAAFALLLISVLSTPIIKQIPLASFGGVDFGVFGFCKGNTCSNVEIGYDTSTLFSDSQAASFDLPTSTRTTLSAILIIHPVAALFTLLMLILAAAAHLHSPSHSPRYLLGIFILSILTLILALLSFLIDVLLFVPHMAWGSYLVLAATILIAASGIVSCAMRRTLVSRKARKRRIAENAEMNGENFYNRQGTDPVPVAAAPMVNGAPGADKLPTFATFETSKQDSDRTSDERIPLTTRSPSEHSPINGMGGMGLGGYGPPRTAPSPPRVDQYGNPMPQPPPGAAGPYGMRSRDPSADPSLNRQPSDYSMNGRGRGGMPPNYRGRGGYPPRGAPYGDPRGGNNGRGGYGPPGYGPQRGGYNGPPRGGYSGPGPYRGGPGMMRGGRGGAPPGYGAPPPMGPGGYDNRGPSPGGRRPSPAQMGGPGYSNDAYRAPPPVGEYAAYNPQTDDPSSDLPRAESPPPLPGLENEVPHAAVGQAIEMDATTGSPSGAPKGFGTFGNLRDSDNDVAGMVGLQQQRLQRQTVDSDASRYSSDQPYVPPRAAWAEGGRSSPRNPASQPAQAQNNRSMSPRHARENSGDNYYEDVDPRFADQPPVTNSLMPQALAPAYPANNDQRNDSRNNLRPIRTGPPLDGNNSYEDLAPGARSPAESERSNFTSVSQRGVNPRWNGAPGPGGYGPPMPNRRPAPQVNDMLLNSNPDFQLPGSRGGRGGMRGGGRTAGGGMPMVPNSAYPGL